MAAEAIPLSVNTDDNLRITYTALADDGLSVTALSAGTDLTYSLVDFNLNETEETLPDIRWGLNQELSRQGRTSFDIEIKYVFGDSGDVAASLLKQGVTGHLTVRHSVPNETVWKATTQVADLITFKAGSQRKDPAMSNGIQTVTQKLFVTAEVLKDQVLVA